MKKEPSNSTIKTVLLVTSHCFIGDTSKLLKRTSIQTNVNLVMLKTVLLKQNTMIPFWEATHMAYELFYTEELNTRMCFDCPKCMIAKVDFF